MGERIERKERKKKKEVQFSTGIPAFEQREFDRSRSELDCTPRGRGSLLLWLVLV